MLYLRFKKDIVKYVSESAIDVADIAKTSTGIEVIRYPEHSLLIPKLTLSKP